MGGLVQYRNRCLIPLKITGLHDFRLEHFVKGLEQFYSRFEPTVYRTFTCLKSQVSELLDLTVERKVVFILLQEDFCQQRRSGYSFVDWKQGHGRYFNGFLSVWRKCRIVPQAILWTYYFLDVQLTRLVFHHTCDFFTDFLVQIQADAFRFDDHPFQYGRSSIICGSSAHVSCPLPFP